MNSEMQLDIWRSELKENHDDLPEPIASVRDENRKAQALVAQINQLAEFGRDSVDAENE